MTHKISGNKSRNFCSKFHPIQNKYTQAIEDRCHERRTCEGETCLPSTSLLPPEIHPTKGRKARSQRCPRRSSSQRLRNLSCCSDNAPRRAWWLEVIPHNLKLSAEEQAQREGCVWRCQWEDPTLWGLGDTLRVSHAPGSLLRLSLGGRPRMAT